MQRLLGSLLLLALLVGFGGFVPRCLDCEAHDQPVSAQDCCLKDGSVAKSSDKQGHPENDCPAGHHHQDCGCTCHVGPSFPPGEWISHVAVSSESTLRLGLHNEWPPESPLLPKERPPLI